MVLPYPNSAQVLVMEQPNADPKFPYVSHSPPARSILKYTLGTGGVFKIYSGRARSLSKLGPQIGLMTMATCRSLISICLTLFQHNLTQSDTFLTPYDTCLTPSNTILTPYNNFLTPSDNFFTQSDTHLMPSDTLLTPSDTFLTSSDRHNS